MYFDFTLFTIVLIGGILIVSAKRVANPRIPARAGSDALPGEYHDLLHLWAMRIGGLFFIAFGVFIATNPGVKYRSEMANDENMLALLDRGQVSEAKVTKACCRRAAVERWAVYYTFTVQDTNTSLGKEFSGNSEGPKEYYSPLAVGDTVPIIYLPDNPEINCEVRWLLNEPTNRGIFKKAGKLGLLDKFRNKFEVRDYSFEEWYERKQQK